MYMYMYISIYTHPKQSSELMNIQCTCFMRDEKEGRMKQARSNKQ